MKTKTKIQKNNFNFFDYIRMFKKRGFRLPLYYFKDVHLFDIINGTDTHTWLPKNEYENKPKNFENGILYMASWNSEIKKIYRVLNNLNCLNKPYSFIDVGCGKGKVCILWKLINKKSNKTSRIIGIDYYKPLIEIAKNNFYKVLQNEGEFYHADATSFDFFKFGDNVIFYLYNPFDKKILDKFLKTLRNKNIHIIYTNHKYEEIFNKNKYNLIYCKNGWHPNCSTRIYKKIH